MTTEEEEEEEVKAYDVVRKGGENWRNKFV